MEHSQLWVSIILIFFFFQIMFASIIISSQECDFDWFSSCRMFVWRCLFWSYLTNFSSPSFRQPLHENLHLVKYSILPVKAEKRNMFLFKCSSSHLNTDLLMNMFDELHLKTYLFVSIELYWVWVSGCLLAMMGDGKGRVLLGWRLWQVRPGQPANSTSSTI